MCLVAAAAYKANGGGAGSADAGDDDKPKKKGKVRDTVVQPFTILELRLFRSAMPQKDEDGDEEMADKGDEKVRFVCAELQSVNCSLNLEG